MFFHGDQRMQYWRMRKLGQIVEVKKSYEPFSYIFYEFLGHVRGFQYPMEQLEMEFTHNSFTLFEEYKPGNEGEVDNGREDVVTPLHK